MQEKVAIVGKDTVMRPQQLSKLKEEINIAQESIHHKDLIILWRTRKPCSNVLKYLNNQSQLLLFLAIAPN